MFGLEMLGTYAERVVGRYEKEGLLVSTARVTDRKSPYETAVAHPHYYHGKIIIVEYFDSKKEAEKGHKKWVEIMTRKILPKKLMDVYSKEVFLRKKGE